MLGHLYPTDIGCPERLEPRPVHTVQVKHLIGDLFERFHIVLGKDITIFYLNGYTYKVTKVLKIVPMIQHIDNVRMIQGNHALKTGIRLNLDGVITKKNSQQQKANQYERPIIKYQPLHKWLRLRRCQVM